MRKRAKYMLATLLMFCFTVNVKAAECSYEKQVELNNIASTVKATYEEVEIDTGETKSYVDEEGIIYPDKRVPVKEKGFNVKILNITKDISVSVTSDDGAVDKTLFYSDSNNGTIDLTTTIADKVITYTIKVYSNIEDCDLELRTIIFITPMYNPYSKYSFCEQYPNFSYCQEYTTDTSLNLEDFINKMAIYKEEQDVNEEKNSDDKKKNFLDFIKENKKLLIAISSIILIVGGTTTVIIIIRKRSRLI